MRNAISTVALLLVTASSAASCARAEAQPNNPRQRPDSGTSRVGARRDSGIALDVVTDPPDSDFSDVLGPRPLDAGASDGDQVVNARPDSARDASGSTDSGTTASDASNDVAHAPLRFPGASGGGPRPPLLGGPEPEPDPPVQADDAGAGPTSR